jgi:hypothetical protein
MSENRGVSLADWRKKRKTTERLYDVPLPSGLKTKARKVPLRVWMIAGRVPEVFLQQMMSVEPQDDAGEQTQPESIKQNTEMLNFIGEVFRYSLAFPRLVAGASPDSEEEIDPAEVPEEDIYALFHWATQGAPVEMKDGSEVSAESVASFREVGGVSTAGSDGGEVRSTPVEPNADQD